MTNATLREFKLLAIDRRGQEFSAEEIATAREEEEFFKNMGFTLEVSDEARRHHFNQNKRGIVYDYLKMAVSILEMAKPDTKGMTRKEGATYDSLIKKLWAAEDANDSGNRPVSVMLDEHEWTQLRDRILNHPFPNRGRATTRFQEDIDNVPKVEVVAAGESAN